MQKLFIIVLLFVYVVLSVGLNIIVHTCGDESETLLATTKVEDPCGCGDEMTDIRCCTTEVTTVKLNDDQKTSIAAIDQQLTLCPLSPVCTSLFIHHDETDFSSLILATFSPPPNNDLCVVNSVFLI